MVASETEFISFLFEPSGRASLGSFNLKSFDGHDSFSIDTQCTALKRGKRAINLVQDKQGALRDGKNNVTPYMPCHFRFRMVSPRVKAKMPHKTSSAVMNSVIVTEFRHKISNYYPRIAMRLEILIETKHTNINQVCKPETTI